MHAQTKIVTRTSQAFSDLSCHEVGHERRQKAEVLADVYVRRHHFPMKRGGGANIGCEGRVFVRSGSSYGEIF